MFLFINLDYIYEGVCVLNKDYSNSLFYTLSNIFSRHWLTKRKHSVV